MINNCLKWKNIIFASLCSFSTVLLTGCELANESKNLPTVKLHFGMTAKEVQDGSTYKFDQEFFGDHWAATMITTPHKFLYEDENLKLAIDHAGGKEALFTHLGFTLRMHPDDSDPKLEYFSVYGTSDYVRLSEAMSRVKDFKEHFLQQQFVDEKDSYISVSDPKNQKPRKENFEDFESAFLNSDLYASEAMIFKLSKNEITIRAIVRNGRRMWGSREDATDRPGVILESERIAKEITTMTRQDLINEPSYSLELQIAGPFIDPIEERRKKRGE